MRPCAASAYAAIAGIVMLLAGCVHEPAIEAARDGQVRVEVTDVAYDHSTDTHYVVLGEKAGHRVLPITIGDDEARAIMFELHGIKPERPLTYQLLLGIVGQTGNQVDRVLIGDVRDEVYYAKIYLDHGRYQLDSRPSDAIAIALGANAPIYVADKLFQAAAPVSPTPSLNAASALGITVQELTPELAQYFGAPVHAGVLIADLGRQVQKTGLERGDIVTEVDGRSVRGPDEFTHAIAAANAGGNSSVALTVTRGNSTRVITLYTNQAPSRAGNTAGGG
ncbi:MAG TPA: bifunctional nuclease domain-containing protein [Candidatus Binataceae bacterium]|nr:bifunctional nuclease domain-containing protein [Candidatus Binataceae bacterium]